MCALADKTNVFILFFWCTKWISIITIFHILWGQTSLTVPERLRGSRTSERGRGSERISNAVTMKTNMQHYSSQTLNCSKSNPPKDTITDSDKVGLKDGAKKNLNERETSILHWPVKHACRDEKLTAVQPFNLMQRLSYDSWWVFWDNDARQQHCEGSDAGGG